MGYVFLTGTTGLVGRHVLRELLHADVPVAVMVRPGKGPGVLAGIIGKWEEDAGRLFPRPVVIEGDLAHETVVINEADRKWIAANCDTILHGAASMTFRPDSRGEPFRTNVEGTRNLLEFCRSAGLRKFHHVSTAYICGLRQGRILESEIDVGQTLGNVYEQSKLEAEKLIRAAEWIDELTVYRPASVVGDSQTGYVTNFHGFYLPLQLANVTAGMIPLSEMNARFYSKLGLRGDEGKNLVPVDWLARVIFEIFTNPKHHGRTYHLANEHPVAVVEIQRVIKDAIERYYPRALAQSITEQALADFEAMFVEYMSIYQSHWRDDPKFDITNTREALPHLPCPKMTYDILMRTSKFPVERNFIAPRHDAPPVPFDADGHMARLLESLDGSGSPASKAVGIQINGPGGGQWTVHWEGDRVVSAERGLPDPGAPRLYMNAKTFGRLAERSLSVDEAFNSGRLVGESMNGTCEQIKELFRQIAAPEARQPGSAAMVTSSL